MTTTNRQRAMVATEAAMQLEKDPARYARLERRNAIVADLIYEADPFAGARCADLLWRDQVDNGLWTPAADFSNCLELAPFPPAILIVGVVDGRRESSHEIARLVVPDMRMPDLSENPNASAYWPSPISWRSPADEFVSLPSGELELCALGGDAVVQVRANDAREAPSGTSQVELRGWISTRIEVRTTFRECRLQAGRSLMVTELPVLARLDVQAVPRQKAKTDSSGCRHGAVGCGWDCCKCACNNHYLRSTCRECKHTRCNDEWIS